MCPWRPLSPWGPGGRARCGPAAPRGRRRLPVPVPGLSPVAADSGEARETPSCRLPSALTEGALNDWVPTGRTEPPTTPAHGWAAEPASCAPRPHPSQEACGDAGLRLGPDTPRRGHAARRALSPGPGFRARLPWANPCPPGYFTATPLPLFPSPPPPAPCAVPLAESRAARRGRKAGPVVVRLARRRGPSPAVPSAGVIGLRGAAARARRAACCPAQPWRERWCGRRRTMFAARTSGTTS